MKLRRPNAGTRLRTRSGPKLLTRNQPALQLQLAQEIPGDVDGMYAALVPGEVSDSPRFINPEVVRCSPIDGQAGHFDGGREITNIDYPHHSWLSKHTDFVLMTSASCP